MSSAEESYLMVHGMKNRLISPPNKRLCIHFPSYFSNSLLTQVLIFETVNGAFKKA